MANSVGSVSIDLEARIEKFESDLGRAARVAEQRSNEMRRTLGAVAGALGAAVSVAGLTAWVKSSLDAQDAISKMSQKVGVSTEALSGWQLAAKQAGVDTEGFQKGLVKLSQSAAMVLQNSKQQVDAFKSIGVSVTDSTGHLRDMDKLFPEVIDKLSRFRDGTAKTAVATQIFGRAGADLIPLINAGAAGLAEYTKMAEDFGLVVGSKSAKAAEDFNDHLEQLSFVSKGVANQLATSLAPALADLATKAVSFFRSNRWKETLADISTGAKYVADHVEDIINAVKLLGQIVTVVYAGKLLRLGTEWIGNLTAQGVAVSALGVKTQLSLAQTIKNVGLLSTSLSLVTAAVVGWQIGTYARAQFVEARLAGVAFVDGILTLWKTIEFGANVMWESVVFRGKKAFEDVLTSASEYASRLSGFFSKIPAAMGGGLLSKEYAAIAEKLKPAGNATADYDKKMKSLTATYNDSVAKIHATTGEMADYEIAQEAAKNKVSATLPIIKAQGNQLDVVASAAKSAAKALDTYNKKQQELSAKAATAVAGYIGKTDAPDAKAWSDYANVVRQVAEAEGARITAAHEAQKSGVKGIDIAKVEAEAQRDTASALNQLASARDKNLKAANDEINVGDRMAAQALQEASLSGMSERNQSIARAGIAAENDLKQHNIELNDIRYAQQVKAAQQGAAAAYDLTQQLQFQKQVAQEYTGFWENATSSVARSFGDLFTGQTKSFKDFGSSLKSIAKQFVSDLISQFIRLRVLGPLLNGAMGAGAGWLGIAGSLLGGSSINQSANYYGNGGTIGSSPGSFGGAGGSAGGGYGGFVSNIQTAKSAYNYLFGSSVGVSPGATGQVAIGANAVNANPSYFGGSTGASYGAVPYASIGGGLLGAYYGSKQGSGGFNTAASTVAYGALGAGVAGTAAGVAGGASLGAAATGAFGAAAASVSWVPIVGWIIAAAAIVDHFSGGKVFGTKYATGKSNLNLAIGPQGPNASASLDQWRYSGVAKPTWMGALTGGISNLFSFGDKDKKTVQQKVTPEMLAAAKMLYDNIEKTLVDGAKKLGVDVPEMLTAGILAQTTYDKKGKKKGTEYIVNYLGKTWKEATADLAAQRIGAEAVVKVVAASAGEVAQTIAEQWRDSAATLLDGAQLMIAAQADINKGNSLIALGATATLSQVVTFVQGLQAEGEKLADTYNRLAQASASYLQFVGQFEPAGVGFAYTMQQINKTMLANIQQANDLAIAAGLSGAREKDLANIHRFAAQQAADAIAALSAASQDLATSLYGTVQGLAHATAITAQLTSKLQASTQLAIGDSSPLNEKAKLDIALKGLRSGITSADDVLALGRKLYASSADYTGLYNKVTDILGMSKASGGSDDLSAALTNYNKLIAQAAATARFGDAKQLAQNISDISSVQGVGYGDIASGLGVNLQDLAKDLGLTDIRGYLDTLKQEDVGQSVMSSSATIVDAIRGIGHDIVAAILGGPVVVPGPTSIKNIGTADPDQTALLAKLSAQLDAVIQHTGDTAKTNKTMVGQGVTSDLRSISGSTRGVAA